MGEIIRRNFKAKKTADVQDNVVWRSRDKRITLFTRRGAKKKVIHYRISVPNGGGFQERKTTGFENLEEAKRVVLDRFDDLMLKARRGQSLQIPTFEKVAKEYVVNLRAKVANGTRKLSSYRIDDIERRLTNYLVPFFGDRTLDLIYGKDMDSFYEFRRRLFDEESLIRKNLHKIRKGGRKEIAYTVVDPVTGKKIKRDYPKGKLPPLREPNASTFQLDRNLMLATYKFAKANDYIGYDELIDIEKITYVGDRRGFFDHGTWERFIAETGKVMRTRRKKFRAGDGKRYAKFYYTAAMLHYWALLSAHTGLRPNEMKAIKYKDTSIEHYYFDVTEKDEPCAVLSVVPPLGSKGIKQRRRDAIGTYARSAEYLTAIQDLRQEILVGVYRYPKVPEPNEFLIQTIIKPTENWDGIRTKKYDGLEQTLRQKLITLDLLKDEEGRDRSAYSFRHTYATFRMKNGADYMGLATQMGTSVQRIKDTYSHVTTRDNVAKVNVMRLRAPLV